MQPTTKLGHLGRFWHDFWVRCRPSSLNVPTPDLKTKVDVSTVDVKGFPKGSTSVVELVSEKTKLSHERVP